MGAAPPARLPLLSLSTHGPTHPALPESSSARAPPRPPRRYPPPCRSHRGSLRAAGHGRPGRLPPSPPNTNRSSSRRLGLDASLNFQSAHEEDGGHIFSFTTAPAASSRRFIRARLGALLSAIYAIAEPTTR